MHVIINSIGSAGDINPFILIGRRLKESGHEVDFAASAFFEEKIKRAGLNLLPLGTVEDYHKALSNPDVWKLEKAFPIVWQEVMRAARLCYQLIESRIGSNTIMIGSTLAVGARLIQEKYKLPLATVHLSPSLMLSAYDTPQSATSPLPNWVSPVFRRAWLNLFEYMVLDPACKKSLNEFRQELGLAALSSRIFSRWLHSPELVICAFPEWFAKVQKDWPANSINSNFPLYRSDLDSPLPAELEQFLQIHRAPLVATAGTAMAFARPSLELGLEAARLSGKACVLVCSYESEIPEKLPDNAIHVKYANFQSLLEKAGLVMHHGGIGTSAISIASACPQLINPFAHDQFDNAMRLEKLGVGKMLRMKNQDLISSIRALDSIETRENCIRLKERLLAEKPGEEAIIEIIRRNLLQDL